MILTITDENWVEVIEDTLTVETFTALKKYVHALKSSQRDFPDSVTKLVVNEAKCNMKSHEIKQLLNQKPLAFLSFVRRNACLLIASSRIFLTVLALPKSAFGSSIS